MFIFGLSSLLFTITAINALFISKSLSWKVANFVLIPTSFLCNTNNNLNYIILDYLSIIFLCISICNNKFFTYGVLLSCLYEYNYYNHIKISKSIIFAVTSIYILNKIFNKNIKDYYKLLYIILSGVGLYLFRYYMYLNDHTIIFTNYTLYLTVLWHLCSINILNIISKYV